MTDSSFALARATGIWLTLITVESVHGAMRRLFLEPQLGDLRARQVSVFTGTVLIALVFWFTLKRLGPQPVRRWWTFGLFWLALTLAFEIGLGRVTGMSWDRIVSDFDPRRGGLLAFGHAGHPRGAETLGAASRPDSGWSPSPECLHDPGRIARIRVDASERNEAP